MKPLRSRSGITAVALLILILALGAGAWALYAMAPKVVPTSEPSSSHGSSRPSAAADSTWSELTLPANVLITAAVEDSDGFLAFATDPSRRSSAQLWRTDTKLKWELVNDGRSFSPLGAGLRSTLVRGVARQGNVIVAVGIERLDDDSDGQAAAWQSEDDGQTWTRASVMSAADATMEAVARGPSGWVAVGSDGYPGASTQMAGSRGMAVWRSTDGNAWERVPSSPALRGDAVPSHLVAGAASFIASGFVIPGHADVSPVWESADGRTWQRIRTLQATAATVVGAGDAGWIAGGIAAGAEAAPGLWWSPDGVEWRRAVVQPAFLGTAAPVTIARIAGGWLAMGTDRSLEDQPRIVLWASTDGQTWQQLQVPGFFDLASGHTMTEGATTTLVFGERIDPTAASTRGFSWIRTSP
jgi:hypothetical protein